MSLTALFRETHEDCQPFAETWVAHWLVVTHYTSDIITLVLIGFGFQRRELYLTLFGLLLAFSSLVSSVAQRAIQDGVPIFGCGGPWGLPSYEIQNSACFAVFIILYGMIWPSGRHGHVLYTAGLVALQVAVTYAHVYFNYNSPLQIIVSQALGAAIAWLGQMAIYAWLWPRFPRIMMWSIVRWSGYSDTFCCYCTSDITTTFVAKDHGDDEETELRRVAPPPREPPLP